MTIKITVSGIEDTLAEELTVIKQQVQGAMAAEFLEITRQNFGNEGVDRPYPWPDLSPKYARKVNRKHATMVLTGDLYDSYQLDNSNAEYAEVYTDNPYASAHQNGEGHMPLRPVMPLMNKSNAQSTELTPYAEEKILAAAKKVLDKLT
jgi:phage gpG-like protein